jgi:hypothetical protein
MHPIEWVNRLNSKVSNSETMLMGWQEITEEEFIMYNKKFIESQNK